MKEITYKWLPVIDSNMCDGCRECVLACGPKCLALRNNIATLINPEACGSEEHCIAPCPTKAIRMEWVEHEGDQNIGKWKIENV